LVINQNYVKMHGQQYIKIIIIITVELHPFMDLYSLARNDVTCRVSVM
jgi:hypothetical protein